MQKMFILSFFVFSWSSAGAQKCDFSTRLIYFEEYRIGFLITKFDDLPKEWETRCGLMPPQCPDESRLKFWLTDCLGESCVELLDSAGTVLECGYYVNSLDTLVKYEEMLVESDEVPDELESEIFVIKYFQPLRDGVWQFYFPVYHEKRYRKGILLPD